MTGSSGGASLPSSTHFACSPFETPPTTIHSSSSQFGPPITLELKEPFYVGVGFCSHLPATVDTAVLSNVVLENKAGKVK